MKHMQLRLSLLTFLMALVSFQFTACKGKNRDAEVQTAIQSKIASDPAFAGVNATVKEGTVTLTGQTADAGQKSSVETSVKGMDGVKKVVNNITVTPVTVTQDDPLNAAVQQVVASYPGVQAEVNAGVITVRGELEREKWQALRPQLDALNPRKVDNQQLVLK
ncbi:MAG TPA: BON domain-containing protein [Chitinophagaceae bacterium]|nr:BON domain-containing protein [Chitinophagaceae bacterium]